MTSLSSLHLTHNFLDLWQQLIHSQVPGWEIYQEDGITCLKSPIPSPRLNFAWGFKNEEDLEKARVYFEGKSFAYLGEESDPFNAKIPHDLKIPIIEMFLKQTDFHSIRSLKSVKVEKASNPKDFENWAQIAHEAEGLDYGHVLEFSTTFHNHTNERFLLAYKESHPVAVAEVNISSEGIGLISSVGVLEKERKHGIGTTIMEACIKDIFESGGKYAALFSYAAAEKFYKKMGFVPVRHWELLIVQAA